MARVAADQYQMHLALHLYHVSAPLPRSLEIFRSTRVGTVGAAGVGRWVRNQLWNSEIGESDLSFLLFFVPSASRQTWHSHEFDVGAPWKRPRVLLSDRWGEVKIARGCKATPSDPSSPRPSAPPPWTPLKSPPVSPIICHRSYQHGAHNTSPLRQRPRQYKGAHRSSSRESDWWGDVRRDETQRWCREDERRMWSEGHPAANSHQPVVLSTGKLNNTTGTLYQARKNCLMTTRKKFVNIFE